MEALELLTMLNPKCFHTLSLRWIGVIIICSAWLTSFLPSCAATARAREHAIQIDYYLLCVQVWKERETQVIKLYSLPPVGGSKAPVQHQ